MARIVEVDESMFGDVRRLVDQFNNPNTTTGMWSNALGPSWAPPGRAPGLAIVDGDRVTGYVGTLFVERVVAGRRLLFCNLHSSIVAEDGAAHAHRLLFRAAKVPGAVVTALTPVRKVHRALLGVGFGSLERWTHVLLAAPPTVSADRVAELHDRDGFAERLRPDDRQRLEDHGTSSPCHHLLFADRGRYCYVVYTRVGARVPYALVLHVSDAGLFASNSLVLRQAMMRHAAARFVAVDARLVAGPPPPRSVRVPVRRAYRSSGLEPAAVDHLYSELSTLNVSGLVNPIDEVRRAVLDRRPTWTRSWIRPRVRTMTAGRVGPGRSTDHVPAAH